MFSLLKNNVYDLPTNSGLNYYWCSGFVLSGTIVIQIITGVLLSLLYVADQNLSFACVMGFSNEDLSLWFVRYFHIWGASGIFILLFIHMFRGLYYGSFNKGYVWSIGFILYLLMMVEAFLGYILPWHQMSYWAATVLTGVVQSVPFIGSIVYNYIVGGFGVTNVTLVRMFAAHVILAFVILGLIVIHLFYLHSQGSNNSLSLKNGYSDSVYFHHYYSIKDLLAVASFIFFIVILLLISPDLVLDSEAYLSADPLTTPVNIKPEWYFLFYYAMLRSISSKIGGLVLVIVFIFIFWLPFSSNKSGSSYSILFQFNFWLIVSSLLILTYLGACHPEWPYDWVSFIFSLLVIILFFNLKFLNF
uniref:Cytochrome b n=1 Tax=Paragyrodactylus variegatus TaxID=1415179 RepID=A0A076VCX1_9PLAT|nr:cytochrome b [Paragyrodactylus variegatus]AIK25759.1 cytochrome b [Paragyrodactylus variegatus]